MADLTSLEELGDAVAGTEAAPAAVPEAPVHVQKLDEHGRAYATGKRKDAVARVWLKPGTGKVRAGAAVPYGDVSRDNVAAVLAAEAMGADFGYIGSAFIATTEARADERYKQAIVEGRASDIVYSDLFTGVSGNYLRPSIVAAGLDPDNLPKGDYSTMNFGSGGNTDAKAWRDIWGSGQGIGAVKAVVPAGEMVARLKREYDAARARLQEDAKVLAA